MMGQTDRSGPQVSEHLVMIEVDLRGSNFPEAESVTVLMDASVCSPMRLRELTAVHYAVPIGQVGPAISTTREGYEFVSRRCGTDGPKRGLKMSVYVDDCFCHADDWGKWQGGGHMQADMLDELHAMADRLGLKRAWFQSRPGRPERDQYDLTRGKREQAIRLGAVAETIESGSLRRRAWRRTATGS